MTAERARSQLPAEEAAAAEALTVEEAAKVLMTEKEAAAELSVRPADAVRIMRMGRHLPIGPRTVRMLRSEFELVAERYRAGELVIPDDLPPIPVIASPSDYAGRRVRQIVEAVKMCGPDGRKSFVYFVQGVSGGLVKIGKSDNVPYRLQALQSGSPVDLRVLHCIPGGQEVERIIHRMFRRTRVRGEWFRPNAVLLHTVDMLRREFP